MNYTFAFGLTAYNSPEFIEDPDYVTLEVGYRQWGIKDESSVSSVDKISTHRCTPEDIGLDYYQGKADPDTQKPSFFRPTDS